MQTISDHEYSVVGESSKLPSPTSQEAPKNSGQRECESEQMSSAEKCCGLDRTVEHIISSSYSYLEKTCAITASQSKYQHEWGEGPQGEALVENRSAIEAAEGGRVTFLEDKVGGGNVHTHVHISSTYQTQGANF